MVKDNIMQLTSKEEDKIFGMYLPCDVLCGKQSGWIHSQKQHYADLRFYVENKDRGLKLLLSPISKISDEDAIEVAKMSIQIAMPHQILVTSVALHDDKKAISFDGNLEVYILFDDGDVVVANAKEEDFIPCTSMAEIVDFLRSKWYALPYRGQDLFELGIAIEK